MITVRDPARIRMEPGSLRILNILARSLSVSHSRVKGVSYNFMKEQKKAD